MALVKEDGTGSDPTANTYQEVSDLRAYATARGIDLTASDDAALEVLLTKAMDYLESLRDKFKGYIANEGQPLQWPRADVWDVAYPGALTPGDSIPSELEKAQLALALEARDVDLLPTRLPTDKGSVQKERVEGAVEVVYNNPATVQHVAAFAKADALLAPLLKRNGLFLVRS